jgi:probable DNA metabolism protein
MVYLYDGSFEGALSAIYEMFYAKDKLGVYKLFIKTQYQYQIFDEVHETKVDMENVEKVVASIIDTFGEETFRRIGYAFLSEDEMFGTKLYRCLKKAYKIGSNAFENLSDPDILAIYKCFNAVARESHKMVGFIRFSELEQGIFYAKFEPTYDLLGLMIPHFVERLGDQMWVIHDTKRRKAAFYNKQNVHISDLDPIDTLSYSSHEMNYQKMWKTYFDNIAIEARKNPKLHRQMMPKKYWNFLTEKNK